MSERSGYATSSDAKHAGWFSRRYRTPEEHIKASEEKHARYALKVERSYQRADDAIMERAKRESDPRTADFLVSNDEERHTRKAKIRALQRTGKSMAGIARGGRWPGKGE